MQCSAVQSVKEARCIPEGWSSLRERQNVGNLSRDEMYNVGVDDCMRPYDVSGYLRSVRCK